MRKKTTVIINGDQRYKIKRKLILIIILLSLLIWMLNITIAIRKSNIKFVEENENINKLNAKTVFSIDKIYLYSSANAVQNVEHRAIWNLNLYQFTDIAIYINNNSDEYFNYENTIKEIYIENINFFGPELGKASLYYKNINDFGKSLYSTIEQNMSNEQKSSIVIDVLNEDDTNSTNNGENVNSNNVENADNDNLSSIENQNENNRTTTIEKKLNSINTEDQSLYDKIITLADKNKIENRLNFKIINDGDIDYSAPELYTDCSNPITLEFVNNIKQNQILSDINSDVVYDGSLLKKSGILLDDIQASISFRITLINNYNQEFFANVYIDIPLRNTEEDIIYNGKCLKKIESDKIFRFLRTK